MRHASHRSIPSINEESLPAFLERLGKRDGKRLGKRDEYKAHLQQAQHRAVHRAAAGVERAVHVAADEERLRVRRHQVAPQARAHLGMR